MIEHLLQIAAGFRRRSQCRHHLGRQLAHRRILRDRDRDRLLTLQVLDLDLLFLGIDFSNRSADRLKRSGDDLFRRKATAVGVLCAECAKLIADFQIRKRSRLRVAETNRIRSVTSKLRVARRRNNDRLRSFRRSRIDSDFFRLGVDRANRSGNTTLTPLAAFPFFFLRDVALAHHVKLQRGHVLAIVRHAAASKHTVAGSKISRRNLDELVFSLLTGRDAHVDSSVAESDCDLAACGCSDDYLACVGFEFRDHSHHAQRGDGRIV